MKKKISVLAAVLLAFGLAACGNNAAQAETNETASNTSDEIAEVASSEVTENSEENGGTLVVYFSATGTTKGVAEKIAGCFFSLHYSDKRI